MTEAALSAVPGRAASAPARAGELGWRPVLAAIGLALSAMLVVHGATVSATVATWTRSSYAFCWAVLPTLAYALWHNRRRLRALAPSASLSGIVAASACGVLWLAGDLLNIAAARQVALVAATWAIVLAAVGPAAFRALMPFLSLLVFLVPVGAVLTTPLKHIAVALTRGYAAVAGLPFRTEGFSIFVGTQRYVVIDYCAALPQVLLGLFLGSALGLLVYRRWWKIGAMALLGGGLAVLANALRISGIITYDYLTGSQLTLAQHALFELPALVFGVGALLAVYARLAPETPRETAARAPAPVPGAWLRCAGAALVAAALVSAAPLLRPDRPQPAAGAAAGPALPATASGWTRQSVEAVAADWRPKARMATVRVSRAGYARGGRRIAVFAAQATSRRDKLSGGAVDLAGDESWMPAVQRRLSVCADDRCLEVRYAKLLFRESRRVRHIYAVNVLGEDVIASAFSFRLRRAWAALKGAPGRARLIAIATEEPGGLAPEEVIRLLRALARAP